MKRLSDKELAERVRTANRERAARRRERQEAAGMQQTVLWLPSGLRARVEAATGGRTLSAAVAALLEAGLRHTSTTHDPDSEPVPANREALAAFGHGWRAEGETLEGIAERFNANGWTPDRIPKEPGIKPRADAATAWTVKAVSQLLNRDYPA